jgi:hypothetical protein
MLLECECSTKMLGKKIFCYYFSQMWQSIRELIIFSKFFSGVHTRNFQKCNAPFRLSSTHSFLYNFYFCHISHHSKNLRQYLIYSITMHILPFRKQALIISFPLCRIAFKNLSRTAPRSVVNKRK